MEKGLPVLEIDAAGFETKEILYKKNSELVAVSYTHLADFMKYLDEKVLDHVHGSWFPQLDRENHLLETVWPGKSDLYHALQATLIPYYDPSLSIAVAVKKQCR